jgi:hypothetical protein
MPQYGPILPLRLAAFGLDRLRRISMTGIAAFDAMLPSWWDTIPSYQKINLPKWLAAASDKVEEINVGRHIYVDRQRGRETARRPTPTNPSTQQPTSICARSRHSDPRTRLEQPIVYHVRNP